MISFSEQTATQLSGIYNGPNMVGVKMATILNDLNWQEATTSISQLNSIALLLQHILYYIKIVRPTLAGKPLEGNDKLSWQHEPIQNAKQWEVIKNEFQEEITAFANTVKKMETQHLQGDFIEPKYGTYFKNIQGIIEHTYYHLGQMAIIKKMIKAK